MKYAAFLACALFSTSVLAGPVADHGKRAEELASTDPLAALAELDKAVDRVWSASPLLVKKVALVDSAEGYGIYVERQGQVYKPGEPIRIYIEPVGFAYGRNSVGGSEIAIAVDFALLDKSGEELLAKEDFAAFVTPVRYRNREFQMSLTANLSGLPEGDYVGRFKLRDRHSDKSAAFDIDFTIAQ